MSFRKERKIKNAISDSFQNETKQILVQKNGFLGLFRGISAIASGAAPAHAMYFATYEFCKNQFGGNLATGHTPIANGVAGICATVKKKNKNSIMKLWPQYHNRCNFVSAPKLLIDVIAFVMKFYVLH